jgi:RNA polymerase subunit RPABC4/transcription elongation factor Spt4
VVRQTPSSGVRKEQASPEGTVICAVVVLREDSVCQRCTNKRLTEQGRGAVLALYREGLNKNQVAQRVGVTRWSVTRVLRMNDLIEEGKSAVSAAIKARRTAVKTMMKE